MIGDVRIERATPDDLNPVLALLALHDLPPDALEEHLATMLVARRGGDVVGSAALEVYADGTLLRSVAVAPDVQGQGVGRMLTKAALSLAEANRTPNEACCEPPQIPSIRAQLLATVAASESAWVQPAVHPRSRGIRLCRARPRRLGRDARSAGRSQCPRCEHGTEQHQRDENLWYGSPDAACDSAAPLSAKTMPAYAHSFARERLGARTPPN